MSEHTPPAENTAFAWTFGSVHFDEGRWELSVNGEPQTLEPKPLAVLAYLLRNAGEVVTKDELLDAVWTGRVVVEAVLTNAIAKLRRALGDDDQSPIVTVSGIGYKLMGKVDRRVVKRVLPESRLHAGDAMPRRPNWKLDTRLDASTNETEVWLARHAKTGEKRVFKFSLDGARLSGLKREATVSRLLQAGLGERDDIVRVIDWDFEDAPYFLECEFGGQDLLAWSDAHDGLASIPLTERIDWLRQIAETVDAAHGLGVLHKDLKPANLLLIEQNSTWRPRVADFGSSALTGAAQLEQFGITNLGFTQTTDASSASGTPYYMAPEVVAGGVATAKSDIYALGVLLYQLVTGDLRRPMAPGWESDIEDPLLREDIAKAANGQPDERMASAGELASRLDKLDQRRLQRVEDEHRSIEQANLANQIRRAQARRPWLIAVVFALFAGLGTSLVFMKRAQDAEQETQEQLDSQTALLNFMTNDVLGQASPDVSQSASTTIREAIDNAVEKLDQRFEGKPLIEGKIRVAIGVVYSNLTDLEAAGKQILRARDLLAPANTEPSKLFIDTYTLNIQNLGRLGRFEEANQELDELQEWIQSYPDATPEQWARFYASKVMNLGAVGRHAEAAIAAEKSLEFAQASGKLSENNMDWLSVQRAYQTMLAGKLVEARELYEELIPRMAARDPTYSHRTDAEMNYAELLIQTGDVQKGITIAQRLQGTLTELLGPDHPAVASIYALLGEGYLKKKDFSEAVGEYRKAYDIFLSAFSPSSPYTLETGQAYARCLVAAGNIQEADQLLAQLDANASESLPTDSPLGASIAWERAYLALDAETPAVAESLLPRISAAVLESDQSSGDWDAKVKLLRGRIALSRGDKPEALSQLQDAIDGLQDIESDPSLVEDAHKYKAAAESLP